MSTGGNGNDKPGGYRAIDEILKFEVNQEEYDETKCIFKMKGNLGPTPNDFVDAIERLKFRVKYLDF